MSIENVEKSKPKQRNRYLHKRIKFEEENVTKEVADEILAKERKKSKKKKRKDDANERKGDFEAMEQDEEQIIENQSEEKIKKRKRKKKELVQNDEVKKRKEAETTEQHEEGEGKKKQPSIRELKRQKYAQLLKEQKMKSELALQEKALNYLSRWKHSRSEWKFEKLRQIWLQQNMYDAAKIPEEFWNTLVEYLNNSKGKAKNVIIKEAVKMIESEGDSEEETIKMRRARDIVQNLNE